MEYFCHLCGARLTKENKCEAHIIPRFIWKEYMDRDEKRDSMVLINKDKRPRILNTCGITDDKILCRKCDDEILGKIEHDFKEVWNRVFVSGKSQEIRKDGKLIGWAKTISGPGDIIKTKLFILCCLWRASISSLEDYPLKIDEQVEGDIKKILLDPSHRKELRRTYQCICSKIEDEDYGILPSPHRAPRKTYRKMKIVYFYLPKGYIFIVRAKRTPLRIRPEEAKFGTSNIAFFIANAGRVEGTPVEEDIFRKIHKGLKEMYDSDKERVKRTMLEKFDDVSKEEIEAALYNEEEN